MKCVICGKIIDQYGNDPWPVNMEGECCDECNERVVVPARLKMLRKHMKRNEGENYGRASETVSV